MLKLQASRLEISEDRFAPFAGLKDAQGQQFVDVVVMSRHGFRSFEHTNTTISTAQTISVQLASTTLGEGGIMDFSNQYPVPSFFGLAEGRRKKDVER